MGKKKIAIVDLSQSETPQLRATGVRDQRIKLKKTPPPTPEPTKPARPVPPKPSPAPAKAKPAPKKIKALKKTKKRVKHPRSQAYLQVKNLIDKKINYSPEEAIKLLRQVNIARFDPSVELHCNLNLDKLSGELSLPHGTGKTQRIEIASEKTLAKLNANQIDFDVLIASPAIMPKLAKYAKLLGPKGLMPNPKTGTISDQPEAVAKKLSSGLIRFKSEAKAPLVHLVIGKLSFKDEQLLDNLTAAITAINPKNISQAFLCSSISPSIKLKLS
jgi:large subunit ribosomal protein L1